MSVGWSPRLHAIAIPMVTGQVVLVNGGRTSG
jgi:hypothetical protein